MSGRKELTPEQIARLAAMKSARNNTNTETPKTEGTSTNNPSGQRNPRQDKPSKYSDIDKLDLSTTRQVGAWSDDHFTGVRIYEVAQLDTDTAVTYGKKVFNDITTSTVNTSTVAMMLSLAVSVKSTSNVDDYLLEDMNKKMTDKIPLPTQNVDGEDDDDAPDDSQLSQLGRFLRSGKPKTAEEKIEEKHKRKNNKEGESSFTNKTAAATAYAYAAAFLMRLQCREPDRVISAYDKAKNRFSGFYDDGAEILEELLLTDESLQKVKDILARKPEVTSTWVAWAAHAENEIKLAKQDRGLLEYLALMVFAYQGMHVVVQILTIHEITKYPLGGLLKELDCRMTRSAVQEVYKIIKNYHKNSIQTGRKHYFRYARVWDEGYFSRVQSKHCAQLLYVAAKTVKELGTNSASDPTQIYVVRNMSESMRAQLDAVSDRLIDIVLASNNDDEEAGTIWKTKK